MKMAQHPRRAALGIGVAGAFLVSFTAGPASAACGYMMTEHPLHGQLREAASQPAPAAAGRVAGDAHATTDDGDSRAAKAGDWRRGDFPTVAENDPDKTEIE